MAQEESCETIQKNIPQKEANHGVVIFHVSIGNIEVGNVFTDLGESVNILPLSIIKKSETSKQSQL